MHKTCIIYIMNNNNNNDNIGTLFVIDFIDFQLSGK